MKTLVIYSSTKGNTRLVAEAIAGVVGRHGAVEVLTADEAPTSFEADLVLVGGPTERHGMTEAIIRFFERLSPGALRGTAAAAFDTRLAWPRLLSGSAAADIEKRLHAAGAIAVGAPGSFIVSTKPELEPGEIARAEAWAAAIVDVVESRRPAVAPA